MWEYIKLTKTTPFTKCQLINEGCQENCAEANIADHRSFADMIGRLDERTMQMMAKLEEVEEILGRFVVLEERNMVLRTEIEEIRSLYLSHSQNAEKRFDALERQVYHSVKSTERNMAIMSVLATILAAFIGWFHL
ncbi:hypothetical protein CCP4SC76_3030001 [Gammaproteobacteria bacterium]